MQILFFLFQKLRFYLMHIQSAANCMPYGVDNWDLVFKISSFEYWNYLFVFYIIMYNLDTLNQHVLFKPIKTSSTTKISLTMNFTTKKSTTKNYHYSNIKGANKSTECEWEGSWRKIFVILFYFLHSLLF